MEVTYTNSTGKLTLKTEAANAKAVFETLAELGEVFDETACGCCNSERIRFDVRRPQSFTYYNLVCKTCGARLDFGQHTTGDTLFAKRKDDSGNPLACNGWYVYQGTDAPATQAPKPEAAKPTPQAATGPGDPYILLIQGATTEQQLKGVVDLVNVEIKAKRLFNGRRSAIERAVEVRKEQLGLKAA